jgi:hypothetical protein
MIGRVMQKILVEETFYTHKSQRQNYKFGGMIDVLGRMLNYAPCSSGRKQKCAIRLWWPVGVA